MVRTDPSPDALNAQQRRTYEDGLVLVLSDIHERLDRAVADAYGWPADLSDAEMLARLVALNQERHTDEASGRVLWLRPDYQIPRFGSAQERARQIEADLVEGVDQRKKSAKMAFPVAEIDQTAAIMALLLNATTPLNADAIAASFKQGRRVLGKVQEVLSALVRMGIASIADGSSFTARRAA